MKRGKLLGAGKTAEVYEWGQDKILKLYFDKYSNDEWVNHEAEVGRLVHQSGVHSPAVFEMIEVDGRKGIIYQRVYGKTISEELVTEPWEYLNYLRKIANLQYYIHKFRVNGLPTQKERFTKTIKRSSHILLYRQKRILDYMESLPDGKSICHGDLYFNNIMVSGKTLVPIDWNSAYTGNPAGDVARTCIILRSPGLPDRIPSNMSMLTYYPRMMSYQFYMKEYIRLSEVSCEDIDAWTLPVAASKLKDNVPGERNWLMDIIDKRLEQLS